MDRVTIVVDGIEIRAANQDVERAMKLALGILHNDTEKRKERDIINDIRWMFIQDGKIAAIKHHREYMYETTGSSSLIESKHFVEEHCSDIEGLKQWKDNLIHISQVKTLQDEATRLRARVKELEAKLNPFKNGESDEETY